jgi:hypothetical protein
VLLRCALLAATMLTLAPAAGAQLAPPVPIPLTETMLVHYRAHDGVLRPALVMVPSDYHGQPIPLVISPHGRGVDERENELLWGRPSRRGRLRGDQPGGRRTRAALVLVGRSR